MRSVVQTNRFRRDWKREIRSSPGLSQAFVPILELLVEGKPLPPKARDHALSGKWTGFRDCHLRPDLVLIYGVTEIEVTLMRIGSHAELFG
jgi:mRNA interferase YafQ